VCSPCFEYSIGCGLVPPGSRVVLGRKAAARWSTGRMLAQQGLAGDAIGVIPASVPSGVMEGRWSSQTRPEAHGAYDGPNSTPEAGARQGMTGCGAGRWATSPFQLATRKELVMPEKRSIRIRYPSESEEAHAYGLAQAEALLRSAGDVPSEDGTWVPSAGRSDSTSEAES
jgi:hypothetical protein